MYKIQECVKIIYKNFIKLLSSDEYSLKEVDSILDDYDKPISFYLNVEDYEKYLFYDDIKLDSINCKIDEEINTKNNSNNIINILNNVSGNWILELDKDNKDDINSILEEENSKKEIKSITKNVIENSKALVIGNKYYKNIDKENSIEDNNKQISLTNEFNETNETNETNNISLLNFIKKTKAVFWVDYPDYYKNQIALAESYGITVLKAKNRLFIDFFNKHLIPKISSFDNIVSSKYNITENNTKTFKEKQFLLLLEPIRKKYNLPKDTFSIANIDIKYIYNCDGKEIVVKRLNNVNSSEIKIYGLTYDGNIFFDRKALNLKRFKLSITENKYILGKHELRCLLCNIGTIAHELSHRLYNTEDNTVLHYTNQELLQDDITKFLIKKIQ